MGQVFGHLAAAALLGGAVAALAGLVVAAGAGASGTPASAQPGQSAIDAGDAAKGDCRAWGPEGLTPEAAEALHLCIAARLHAGYLAGLGDWRHAGMVRAYPGWTAAAAPALSPAHGGRFLAIRVSPEGAGAYAHFAEDPEMPVGTRIAAESFSIDDSGAVAPGPLYLMEKVPWETSPETMGWYYMAVGPDGVPMGIDPWAECNDCHVGRHAHKGGLGYPPEAARLRR